MTSDVRNQLEAEPQAAGISTAGFGTFGRLPRERFEYAAAMPILVDWIPRAADPDIVEAPARSLTGEEQAKGEGARRVLALFVTAPPGATASLPHLEAARPRLEARRQARRALARIASRERGT
jgi:hypothetical protein